VATLLHIAASPRADASQSRRAAQKVIAGLRGREPAWTVVLRDLAAGPIPHLTAFFMQADSTAPAQRSEAQRAALSLSETLIHELDTADAVLVSMPMHNFTVPSVLKSWIDHVVRRDRTFRSTVDGKVGLLRDRPVCVLMACGGAIEGTCAAQEDWATPYLRYVLRTIGLTDVQVIALENCNRGAPAQAASLARLDEWLALQTWPWREGRASTAQIQT
jgi:FMN-dependent NADH-azoreductase